MNTPVGATDYVLSRSAVCRRFKTHTRMLVLNAVDFLSLLPDRVDEKTKGRLTAHLKNRIREKNLGNPILIWILLNIVLPIVVRLILEWWKNRDGSQAARDANVPCIRCKKWTTAAKWVHGMGPYCVDCAVELLEGAG